MPIDEPQCTHPDMVQFWLCPQCGQCWDDDRASVGSKEYPAAGQEFAATYQTTGHVFRAPPGDGWRPFEVYPTADRRTTIIVWTRPVG